MFERFSEHGRQVVVLAQDEARSLGHDRIGSEHVLLGLVRQDDDLVDLLGDPADLRTRVVELVGHGESAVVGEIHLTEHATAVMQRAAESGRSGVGPHELALALLSLPADATALAALRAHGVSVSAVRDELVTFAGAAPAPQTEQPALGPVAMRVLETAARHAEDVPVGAEHVLLALVLEAPDLAARTLGIADGWKVHERLAGLLDGPERPAPTAGGRDIAVLEAALANVERAGRHVVTPEDMLLGLLQVAPDVVARAAVDLAAMEATIRALEPAPDDDPRTRLHRYSQAARNAVARAQDEARLLDHAYVGTEHLLLALIRDEHGVAGRVLADLRVDLDEARIHVERVVGRGAAPAPPGELPFSGRATRILRIAFDESFRNTDIDTGHLLLAIERDDAGVAVLVLGRFGISGGLVRRSTLALLAHAPVDLPAPGPAPATRAAFEDAERESAALGKPWTGCEHLLLALIRRGGRVAAALLSLEVTLDDVRSGVIELGGGERDSEPFLTARLVRVVVLAERLAQQEGRPQADAENLIVALARDSVGAARELLGAAADEDVLRRALGAH